MYLNANIPPIECFVRGNYLRDQKDIAVLKKTIEVLELEIEELKESNKNPLTN